MGKPVWTLQIVRNQLRGSETTYTVKRQPGGHGIAESGAISQASPQSWGRLRGLLEQVARLDPQKVAAFKKELDETGTVEIANVPLDSFDLRLIGFSDA
jgi:hypothetical protein